MIYPNKHIKFEESIIFKMTHVLSYLSKNETTIQLNTLYSKLKGKYSNIDEFLYSIDILYVLDIIEYDYDNNLIKYVKRN